MTRRITLAILVTVWTILIVVGVGAYIAIRGIMLADLDASLLARALAQPQVMDQDGNRYLPVSPLLAEDRFIVKNEIQQTVVRSTPDAAHEPQKVRAAFLD